MGKKLVLCADGTGNKGGTTPDSNVFKIFNAIVINDPQHVQLTFYDNGVGTSNNSLLKALGGGAGVGFKKNVCDLYAFLMRNYQPGDDVFLFGFSRGAATIRALTGFIACCGLLERGELSQDEMSDRIETLFDEYEQFKDGKTKLTDNWPAGNLGAIEITFVGVWDTVSALGFPQGTDITGPLSWLLNQLLNSLDYLSDKLAPHRFYQYQLFDNIKHAYHALSIDDERTAFKPLVWDETGRQEDSIEQLWFSGMHSNVGGGYNRDGLAYISLFWMMAKAQQYGLVFKENRLQEARADANPRGYMYNSRGGLGIFYRYHPREIKKLCNNKVPDIKIDSSVIERMSYATGDYAPGYLPEKFSICQMDSKLSGAETCTTIEPGRDVNWATQRAKVDSAVYWGKISYILMLFSTLGIVGFAIYFYNYNYCIDKEITATALQGHIADILKYFLPKVFGELIDISVIYQPGYFIGALAWGGMLWKAAHIFKEKRNTASVALRKIVLKMLNN